MTPLPPDEFDGEDRDTGDDEHRDDELMEEGEDLLGFTDETDAVEGEEEAEDQQGFTEETEAVEGDEGFTDETDVYAHELADEAPPPATWAGRQGQAGEQEPISEELEPVSEEVELEPPSEELEPPSEEVEQPSEELEEPAKAPEPPSAELEAPEPPSEALEALEPPSPELAAQEPPAEESPAEAEAPGPTDTAPMPAVAASAGPVVGQPKGLTPAEGGVPPGMVDHPGLIDPLDDDKKPPKAGLWPRFLAAAFVIVVSMAAAMSTTGILYITDIAKGLEGLPEVVDRLEKVDGGDPQTILIIGSDKRTGAGAGPGLSDTTMLLRLDDDKSLISLMSLPRDLQVNIPGYGVDKLNAAYSYGGEELTLQTVQELTGLEINHLVNVGFEGFAKAVDAIDCVYIDVDRDYYHVNTYGTEQYSEIDIDPGYQRLCGPDALAYVRFRHDDNDIVRGARQQDFLREARAKVDPEDLFINNRDEYLKIFTDYTTSDIDDAATLIQLLKLFVDLADAEVQKVEFHGDIGDATSTYVTTSNTQLKIALAKFLGQDGGESSGSGNDSIPPQKPDEQGGGAGGGGADQPPADEGGGGSAALIDTSDSAQAFGGEFAKEVHFPVLAPTQLPEGSVYDDDSISYGVDAPDGVTYGGYKFVFSRFGPYGVDEYFGVMGTKWRDPPILDNESETRTIDGRDYLLFYDGGRLRVVGFKTDDASYWVSNSLTHSLDENEMLGIAQSMTEIEKN